MDIPIQIIEHHVLPLIGAVVPTVEGFRSERGFQIKFVTIWCGHQEVRLLKAPRWQRGVGLECIAAPREAAVEKELKDRCAVVHVTASTDPAYQFASSVSRVGRNLTLKKLARPTELG